MNNRILFIGESESSIADTLNCKKINYNNQSSDDEIHQWLLINKSNFLEVEKIIIPCRLGHDDAEFMGIYIGLHIRLTKELENARFLPIIFLSESTKEEILENQISTKKIKSSFLLFTTRSYLISSFDLKNYLSKSIAPIPHELYDDVVLPTLNIESTKDLGHQLANEWGALRLAKFAGYLGSIAKPTSLYFKYKDVLTNNEIKSKITRSQGKLKESCSALLIDDNANLGWDKVLEHILEKNIIATGYSVVLEKITSYEEADKVEDYSKYDLIFLDLRLLKNEDIPNNISNVKEFSGAKILKKIKDINKGIQVILFTASNKIWNIEKLMDKGANGYYIKESPKYILSSNFSSSNYKSLEKTIKKCLERKSLKDIFFKTDKVLDVIKKLVQSNIINKDTANSLRETILSSNNQFNKSKTEKERAWSYIGLFKCIEILNDNYITRSSPWEIIVGGSLKQFRYSRADNVIFEPSTIDFTYDRPSTFEKIAGFSGQFLELEKTELLALYHNVQRRNNFIHNEEKDRTTIQETENEKIYGYEGYLSLMSSLHTIFCKLKEVYLP